MKLKNIILVIALIVAPCFLMDTFAQLPPSGGADVPLDGGVTGLLIAAGVYGARKVHVARKNRNTEL